MPRTSSDTLTPRAIISLHSGWIYEEKMKLEMYIMLENKKHSKLPRLEQQGKCLPLGSKRHVVKVVSPLTGLPS